MFRNFRKTIISVLLILSLAGSFSGNVLASQGQDLSWEEKAQLRMDGIIQSNLMEDWPEGPKVPAEAAIVLECDTGTILYAKNIHEELFPASTTKLLTCLIAVEEGDLSDTVYFSKEAVEAVPSDGSNIGISAGEYMSLEECLYGIMVGSANEAANAVAEYVSGSIEAFAEKMNERAEELGCMHSHFVNPNGLHDDYHYTSAYDLALIGRAFFENEYLSGVGGTARYHFEPTEGQPDDFWLKNKHKLKNGDIKYPGVIGGKTGYTSLARETLVTCAERDGMRLICVVLYDESPSQFTDTVTLFDYGFDNFSRVKAADKLPVMDTEGSIFSFGINTGAERLLEYDRDSTLVIPSEGNFELISKNIDFTKNDSWPEGAVALVTFSYSGTEVGKAYLRMRDDIQLTGKIRSISGPVPEAAVQEETEADPPPVITINVRTVVIIIAAGALSLILFTILVESLFSSNLLENARRRAKRRRR